jgi:hypothetical protein
MTRGLMLLGHFERLRRKKVSSFRQRRFIVAAKRKGDSASTCDQPIEMIFPRGAVPELNYVSPHRFSYLKIYLRDPNGGVIVEGPSGIGKTTATRKALNDLKVGEGSRRWFSAASLQEVENLRRALDAPPGGVVVIDDFHHLPLELKAQTARAIKYACDNPDCPTTKFVLIGINKVGYALLDNFPDLHGRGSSPASPLRSRPLCGHSGLPMRQPGQSRAAFHRAK